MINSRSEKMTRTRNLNVNIDKRSKQANKVALIIITFDRRFPMRKTGNRKSYMAEEILEYPPFDEHTDLDLPLACPIFNGLELR